MSGDIEYFKSQVVSVKENVKSLTSDVTEIKENMKQLLKTVNEMAVDLAVFKTDYCGESGENGVKSQVKKNSLKIDELKKGPGKFVKSYLPVIITLILFVFLVYDKIDEGIKKSIKNNANVEITVPFDDGNP